MVHKKIFILYRLRNFSNLYVRMRVLHLCISDIAGAGLCCVRIHQSLLNCGIDSKVVVQTKNSNVPEVYQYESIRNRIYRVFSKICRGLGVLLTERSKVLFMASKHKTTYSLPVSYVDITKCPWYEWADVIHLHWINNYVDYPSFFKKNDKPVVWTLHDESLFYGIAHHHRSILLDDKMECKYRQVKYESVRLATNLSIVFLSKYMYDKFGAKKIIKGKRKLIINNSVNGNIFTIGDKASLRNKYQLKENKIIIIFVAGDINDPNKGLDVLSKAVAELNDNRYMILAIGNNLNSSEWPYTVSYGCVSNPFILSELLSTADIFALPSFQEAFPQSPLEAMACGVPVLSFPVSGIVEAVNDQNGIICNDFTVSELVRCIKLMNQKQYDSVKIREDVLARYSPEKIAHQYIDLYKQVLDNSYCREYS